MPLTLSQQEAIQARGNVIVVAGAGTGKTSTLIGRCVALLEAGCSIESLLMVTFTDAAAAEMRHRLRSRLAELAETDSGQSDWWLEQIALLENARICTLHSFCLQLIRENFHLLGIDPTVKILDEQQVRPLIEGALDACLQPHLAGTIPGSESVRDLLRVYGRGDASGVRQRVLKLHRYAQSLEAPQPWLALQMEHFSGEEPQQWRGWLQEGAREWAELWLPEMEAAAGGAENLARCCRALKSMLVSPSMETIAAAVSEIVAAGAAEWPKGQKTRLCTPFKKLFEEAEFLASQFEPVNDTDGLGSDWANVRPRLRALLQLTREFGEAYAQAKRESGGMDFSDLEQFALRLLWDASGALTPVAQQCRAELEFVFVDECQDINAAQDAILRAVSREGGDIQRSTLDAQPRNGTANPPSGSFKGDGPVAGNRFLVGDVKQSIYQFRLARPELFLGYERQWQDDRAGQRILLSDNFRSAPEIIRFVNALFAPLMRESLGGVDYLPLNAGRPADGLAALGGNERAVEFHLIPKTTPGTPDPEEQETEDSRPGNPAPEDLPAVQREARMVAMRLRELHRTGLEIWDAEFGRRRRVEWRDMAVLLRSPSNRVEAFAQEFHRCEVPLQAARGGFLESTEVTDLLSLLRLLDNPLQDIPLLAVLRSPFVALSLDELAEVRIVSSERRFWMALQAFHRSRPGEGYAGTARSAWVKVDAFLGRFDRWRALLRQSALSQCLESALTETDYEAILRAGERGEERAANVRRLIRMVREYDPYQRQGLFRFLRYVDSLIEAGQDLSPAAAQTQNAVRLMSIHQSKGLEFPVVVVACLGGRFNLADLSEDILLDEHFGLCAKAVAGSAGARYPTLAYWLAARRQRDRSLGEELRLLYVAATRARDRLLLTATDTRKDGEAWEAIEPRPFRRREMISARSPLDWLLLWLPTVTVTEDWQGTGGMNALLRWQICHDPACWAPGEPGPIDLPESLPQPPESTDGTAVAEVIGRIRWKYAHGGATTEPAKTSVSALRKKAAEYLDEEAAPWMPGPGSRRARQTAARELGAARVGTLHHQFLQHIRLAGACDPADLQGQLVSMVERGVFQEAEARVLDIPGIAAFWNSEVGCMIRARSPDVHREVPFTARFSPAELESITGTSMAGNLDGEFVVVQGVADLLVVGESELWLLDFKTDEARQAGLDEKIARYRPQLRLYGAALGAIYGKPVTRSWLHFIRLGETATV